MTPGEDLGPTGVPPPPQVYRFTDVRGYRAAGNRYFEVDACRRNPYNINAASTL
jgi:hypothetical protein